MKITENKMKDKDELGQLKDGTVFKFTDTNEKYTYTEYYMKLHTTNIVNILTYTVPCVNLEDNTVYFLNRTEMVETELVIK